ncbi:MAG: helix-turn-helix domain-containing protein [Paenisporosarcina sp.]
MNENGTSIRETAAIFNISSDATIRKWLKIVETQGMTLYNQENWGVLHPFYFPLYKVFYLKNIVDFEKKVFVCQTFI